MKASRKSFNDHRPATESKQAFFPDDRNTSQNNDVVDFSEVKVLENLKIKIGGAKSLSSGGKDARYCYCSVQLDSEEIYKTRIVERSLRPFFQEEFVFDIPRNFRFLCFHFHDLQDDYISKRDSCIARVKLRKSDLVEFNGVERWHSLVPANARDQVQGQLFVEIKFDQCYNLSPSGFNDNSHKLSVRIPHCQGLFVASGNCDPYLSVTLQGIHRSDTKKSRPKKGTANPSFGEEFSFELNKTNSLRRSWFDLTMGSGEGKSLEEKWDLQILKIVVYNAGTLGDAFLGEVKIPLHNISRLHSGWHLLTSRSDKSNPSSSSKDDLGLLRIKINYTKDLIFPSDVYKQLLDNLLQSSLKSDLSASWPALIGAICGIKKQPIVAQHLVHIFLHQSSLLNLILPLADFEISSTGNLQMIFRNSSFTSFIIHESLLVIGQSYLHKVLLRAVERIVAEGRSCEIDPARLKLSNGSSLPRSFEGVSPNSQDMLHNNKEQLWTYVELILYSIIESAPDCPELLCGLFNDLRACAIKHFPDDVNVKYRVVTNFLFLRFFSAALLCPRKYKLISVELNATTNRTFTLLSKSIQLLCNLTLPKPSTKNPADSFCKIFLEEYVKSKHLEKLKNFIDVISASPGSSSRVNQPVEKVTLKEGEMVKRAQGRTLLFGRKNFKIRYFVLTNYELSYGKEKKGKPLCVIPVQHIKGVEKLQEDSFSMSNMFQVIQPNRVLYCKANNSVEQKEWMDVLTKVCNCNKNRAQHYHPGAFVQGKYTCCAASAVRALGCTEATGLPTSVRLNIDQDRDLERLYVALSTSQDHIRSLQEECGARSVYVGPDPKSDDFVDSEAENTDDGENSLLQENNTSQKALPLPLDALDPQQTYRTLCLILDCVQMLDRTHALYKEYATNNCDELGSKNRPYEGLS